MLKEHKSMLAVFAFVICLLCSAQRAKADAVRLTSAAQLDPADVTATHTGAAGTDRSAPYKLSAGGNTVTFNFDTPGLSFHRFDSDGTNTAFASGTQLIDTNGSYGPVTLSFLHGVSEFGFAVQSSGLDFVSFTLSAYDGANQLISFTTDLIDNTQGSGAVSFLGVRAGGGDVIRRLTLSSESSDPTFANFFIVGPVTYQTAPVPEPATMALLGSGLAGLGAALRRRRGKG